MKSAPATVSPFAPLERRQFIRLDVLDRLDGQIVMFNIPLRLRDISAGGLATESSVPFAIGSEQLLRLTTAEGVEVQITGIVTHQRITDSESGPPSYVTGFRFVEDPDGKTARDIQVLLDAVRSELHALGR
jgi:hypothetical protein